jgi:uncharacterized protein (DUF305 family)
VSFSVRPIARKAAVVTAAGLAAVALAACGSSASKPSSMGASSSPSMSMPMSPAPSASPSVAPGAHNAADVTFAQQMIPHHRQAVAMAELAATRAKSQQVKDLALSIEDAQGPEIRQMTAWLTAWGQKVPQPMDSSMPGMSSSMPGMDQSMSSPMPGIMSDSDMAKLKSVTGAAFDKLFLTMMITHHDGALTMAKTEQSMGQYGPAKAMAASITASQSKQIALMKTLLGQG